MLSETEVIVWSFAAWAGLAVLTGCALLAAVMRHHRRRRALPVWSEGERHLSPEEPSTGPAHRRSSPRPPKGRHAPGRGRFEGLSRQAQLEERTVPVGIAAVQLHEHQPYEDGLRLRCRVCQLDLERPASQPEIGGNGFSSW